MIKFTNHPLVDVGAAAIAAFAGKRDPEEVNSEDIEELSAYLEEQYQRKYLSGYIVCMFPNSAYVNPTSGADKKRAFLDRHLYPYRLETIDGGDSCSMCGEPAVTRGFRQHVPLLTGEGVLNFFPNGEPGLPLCAGCMLSLAALPLGALRCSGRALVIHADDTTLTSYFARKHVQRNLRLLQLQDQADDKLPDAKRMGTRLIEELVGWAYEERNANRNFTREKPTPTSLTAYHLTNSGQGPDLEMYHLPSPILSFLWDAGAEPYRAAWQRIVQSAWRLDEKDPDFASHRNFLYEDIFGLPEDWPRFMRTYLLRRAYRAAYKDDPRATYNTTRDLDLIDWRLTELFLKGVVDMEEYRVKAIRDFGDRIAAYIAERDKGFWRDFHLARTYGGLRVRLLNASREEEKAGRTPLIGFDDFIAVFEYGENLARRDWKLARDLVLIRVIEQLHERRFFKENPEALNEAIPEDDTEQIEQSRAAEAA